MTNEQYLQLMESLTTHLIWCLDNNGPFTSEEWTTKKRQHLESLLTAKKP